MKKLVKGGNAPLATTGKIGVSLSCRTAPCELDIVCFAVTAAGSVPADEWFLFYNQPRSPAGEINFSASGPNKAEFWIDLDALPTAIQKCVFAAALDGAGSFADVSDAVVMAVAPSGERLIFKITEAFDGRALIFAEVYRHQSGWKMRAIGQGFNGGLKPLAENYGVKIANDEPQQPAPPPAPPPASAPARPRSEPPARSGSPSPAPRRSRVSFFGKLLRLLIILLVLIVAAGATVYFYPPLRPVVSDLLARLPLDGGGADLSDLLPIAAGPALDNERCTLSEKEVFDRYHVLGEHYLVIRKLVGSSNYLRARVARDWREDNFQCTEKFIETSRKEIDRLGAQQVEQYLNEATALNVCAGMLIGQVETELDTEARPALIQRLMQNADRTRNLESDLTNISRDLAYFRNKIERLITEYESNIEACSL